MKKKIVQLVKDHPIIAVAAGAAAGYYGGPAGVTMLQKLWSAFGG